MDDQTMQRPEEAASELIMQRVILIADGALSARVLFLSAFSGENVLQAETGEEALSLLKSRRDIALVVLGDLAQPDAYSVLDGLRADPSCAFVSVLMLVDGENPDSVQTALSHGAQDILARPVNITVARQRAENLLDAREAHIAAEQNRLYRAELAQREEQLYSSRHDPLTGLLNRSSFAQEVREAIEASAPNSYVLSCLDIDSFKVINDRFGHAEGDRLLRFVAETRRNEVGQIKGLACRDMADTFLTLLPNDDTVLSSVTQHFFDKMKYYDLPMVFSAHIGRYIIDEPCLDVDLMIDRAILAMQSVKGSADVRVAWFDDGMRRRLLREQELVDEMRPALAQGQFILYYQPQYDYSTGTLVSAEALVRWQHPEKGLISPGEFIPLFEKNGFISSLDEYVWEQSCRSLRRWADAGLHPVPVSVNISRRDIRNPDLPALLAGLVQNYGLTPDQLHLEITESAYVDRPQQLIRVVRALQVLGFSVEMDDFGSGYSSLNTLKDVPVDRLKLDMQFSSATGEHSRGGSILSSIVRMAHWLHLPVIAEGVETKEQADYLKSIGCVLMQGYFFAKPMPADDFEILLSGPRKSLVRQNKPVSNGIQGAADFLDASTQATLLFNSFVGGAEIIEFDGEHAEVLRTNDRFYEVLGCTRADYSGKELDLLARFYPESRKVLLSALREAIRTNEEVQCELRSYGVRDARRDFWTRDRIRYLSRNVQRYIFYISVENITESRELEHTRERLDRIVRNVPAGIAIYELGKKVSALYVSDRACTILGFTPSQYEAARRENKLDPFLPDESILRQARAAREGDAPIDVTVPVPRPDGRWIWLRVVASVVRPRNNVPLVYAALLDVTSQHESEEELLALLRSMPGGVIKYAADSEGHISFVSDGLLQLLGYTGEQFKAKFKDRFPLLVYEEDRERVLSEIEAQVSGASTQDSCEYRIEMGDGRLRWFLDVGRLVHEADGSASFYVIVIDADDRKQLETRLAEESQRSAALVANVPGGVITLAVRRDSVICEYFSDGVCRLLGYSREEMRTLFDQGVSSFIHPDDRSLVEAASEKAVREHRMFSEEYRLKHKDGHYIWINLTGNPVTGRDGVLRFFCAYTNITEFMLAEQRLRVEKQKTEQAMHLAHVSVWEYDVVKGEMFKLGVDGDEFYPQRITGVPDSLRSAAFVDPVSVDAYIALHQAVQSGAEEASDRILLRSAPDQPSVWYRVSYRTVFSGGTPVSAIGSAVNIEAEAETILQMKEMALAMDASSLYFWAYDDVSHVFVSKNRNAEQITSARFSMEELTSVLERSPLLPDERERTLQFIRNKKGIQTETCEIILHLNGQYRDLEWLRLTRSPVCDMNGHVTAYVVIGEDITARARSERLYAEALHNLESLDDGAVAARMQANLTRDEFEMGRTTFLAPGDRYSDGFERLLSRIPNESQRKRTAEVLARDVLLKEFASGQSSVTVRYQIQLHANMRPLWVQTTANLYRDPQTGDVKTFQYVRDVDDELVRNSISRTVSQSSFELLGLIYLQNGWLHCYTVSALESGMGISDDTSYREGMGIFIDRYMLTRVRDRARVGLALDTIVRKLNEDGHYQVVFPITDGSGERFKQWRFFWLDSDRTNIVVARADVTESRALQSRSEELQLALASSNTVFCRYDIAHRELTMPPEYATLFGLPSVMTGVPDDIHLSVSSDEEVYRTFFSRIRFGDPKGEATVQFLYIDGSRHWCHATFTTQFDSFGSPESAVITVRDVTLQRTQEIENERMRVLIEQNNIAIIDYDVRSDTLYVEVNHASHGIVRRAFSDYSRTIEARVEEPASSTAKLRELIVKASKHADTGTLDYEADVWGTGCRWVRLHYSSLADDTGAVYRIVGQVSDIQAEHTHEVLLAALEDQSEKARLLPTHDPVLVSRIFQYLYDAPEFDTAIRTILQILGEHYGASRVYIHEDLGERKTPKRIYEWCAKDVCSRQNARLDTNPHFDSRGVFCCNDSEQLPERARASLKREGVRARLQCILHSDVFSGLVGVDDCVQTRMWSSEQIGTLTLISHVLCVYLAHRHAREAAILSQDFLSALDDSASCIYVVDPVNYHILYNNRTLRDRFGDHTPDHICYKVAVGRDSPCEECPIRAYRTTGRSVGVEIERPDGIWMLSQASPIHWGGRKMFMVTCTDITEQRALERQRAIGQMLGDAVQKIPGHVYSLSPLDGHLDYISDSLCHLTGYSRAEISEQFHDDYALLICPEDRQIYRGTVRKLCASMQTITLEYRLERADSTLYWVSDTLKYVMQDDAAGWICAAVTEIDRTRDALVRLQALTDAVQGGVIVYDYVDHQLTIRSFSDGVCRMTGYSREEYARLTSQDPWALISKSDLDAVQKMLGKLLATGHSDECVYRIRAKEGIRSIHLSACVLDRGVRGSSFCAVLSDVTRQVEKENSQAYRDVCIQRMNELLGAGVLVSPLLFDEKPIFISDSLTGLLGYTARELERFHKTQYRKVIHPDDADKVLDAHKRYSSSMTPDFELEYRLICKNGTILWTHEKTGLIKDPHGNPCYLSVFLDLTRERDAQERLRVKEELYRLALTHSDSIVYRYDYRRKTLYMPPDIARKHGLPSFIPDIPNGILKAGFLGSNSDDTLNQFFISLAHGEPFSSEEVQVKLKHQLRWFRMEYTIIHGEDESPVSAIVTFTNIDGEKRRDAEISSLRRNEFLLWTVAQHAGKRIALYDFKTGTITGYGDRAAEEGPIQIFPKLEDYLTHGIVASESVETARAFLSRLRSGKEHGNVRVRIHVRSGALRWYVCIFSTVRAEDGIPSYAIVSFEDVTDTYERELAYQRYRSLLASPLSEETYFVEFDLTQDRFESASENLRSPEQLTAAQKGLNAFTSFIAGRAVNQQESARLMSFLDRRRLLAAYSTGSCTSDLDLCMRPNSDSEPTYIRASYQMISDPYTGSVRILLSCRVIDKEKRAELALRSRAEIDDVTGLLNRATFLERVVQRMAQADHSKLHAFAMLDVDRFKAVNDTFGHVYGDSVLHDVAQALSKTVFRDDLVGRLGGDEFGLFIGGFPDLVTLNEKLDHVRASVRREVRDNVSISASIGVALFPQDGMTFETLYEKADAALYSVKRTERGQYAFYTHAMGDVEHNPMLSPIDTAEAQQLDIPHG